MKAVLMPTTLAMAACAGSFQESVRARAAADFHCPASDVAVQPAHPVALPQAYRAEGCGKNASYEGDCGILFCSVYTSDSQRTEGFMPRGSAEPSDPQRIAPTGLQMVSFTLRNRCPREVLLFYGEHPERSGGTQSSIGANTIESKFMRVGQSIWIIDRYRKPVSVYTASAPPTSAVSLTVEITESCSGFIPRY